MNRTVSKRFAEARKSAASFGTLQANPRTGRRALESGRRSLPERSDEVILIETGDGVQRMTVCDMLDSFERNLEDFEALKVCVG